MSRAGNRNRAKFTVMFTEHDSENKLDVLDDIIVKRMKEVMK